MMKFQFTSPQVSARRPASRGSSERQSYDTPSLLLPVVPVASADADLRRQEFPGYEMMKMTESVRDTFDG